MTSKVPLVTISAMQYLRILVPEHSPNGPPTPKSHSTWDFCQPPGQIHCQLHCLEMAAVSAWFGCFPNCNVGFVLSKFYELLRHHHTYIPTGSPSQSKPCGPGRWEQEHMHPGALTVRRQEGREEESLVGAGRKIKPLKIAKQKMPGEILHCRSCSPEKSLLIWGWHRQAWFFCHQSLRTCFNYAAHQQEFSFWSHKSRRCDTGSIGSARTMRRELSTPSLKSTRCII